MSTRRESAAASSPTALLSSRAAARSSHASASRVHAASARVSAAFAPRSASSSCFSKSATRVTRPLASAESSAHLRSNAASDARAVAACAARVTIRCSRSPDPALACNASTVSVRMRSWTARSSSVACARSASLLAFTASPDLMDAACFASSAVRSANRRAASAAATRSAHSVRAARASSLASAAACSDSTALASAAARDRVASPSSRDLVAAALSLPSAACSLTSCSARSLSATRSSADASSRAASARALCSRPLSNATLSHSARKRSISRWYRVASRSKPPRDLTLLLPEPVGISPSPSTPPATPPCTAMLPSRRAWSAACVDNVASSTSSSTPNPRNRNNAFPSFSSASFKSCLALISARAEEPMASPRRATSACKPLLLRRLASEASRAWTRTAPSSFAARSLLSKRARSFSQRIDKTFKGSVPP